MHITITGLYWRLFGIYSLALLAACAFLTYNNIVILGFSFFDLLVFNIPLIVTSSLFIAALLTVVTRWRLKPVWRGLQNDPRRSNDSAVKRLWRLPGELFWWMMACTAVGSAGYHATEWLASFAAGNWYLIILIMDNVMAEMTAGLTSAVLFFIMLRKLVKRYLTILHPSRLPAGAQGTFWYPLIWTFTSCFVLVVFSVLRFLIIDDDADGIRFGWLFTTFAIYFLFAFIVYRRLTGQFRDELRQLTDGIRGLLQGNRSQLHETVPVLSIDEIGQLASAFNELQTNVATKYEALDRELALASEMQRQLLPGSPVHSGTYYTIVSRFKPAKEVGGDLYDIVPLDDMRTAVLIGDVSGKGMPAALLMSAALALFRSEIQAGGSTAEIVARINRSLTEMLQGDMYVTLGLAIFDASDRTVRYTSAGHMAPYWIDADGVRQIPVSSLPAGIDEDELFEESIIPFPPGSRLVLYTDGIVELTDADGEMIGFDRFEQLLANMDGKMPVESQLEWLIDRLPKDRSPDEDDRTLLLVAMV